MSGATTAEIAAVLGHRTLQMVKRYAHLSDQHGHRDRAATRRREKTRGLPHRAVAAIAASFDGRGLMMTTSEHWRYFLALEQDVERTTRFVEPTRDNYRAFSIEFARLILSACSEVDVVAKVICAAVAPTSKAENMDHYRSLIQAKYPKLHTLVIAVPRFGLSMEPWKEWGSNANPGWWKDHQLVKHRRHESFAKADLEHCLVSAGGLFALLLYLCHKEIYSLEPSTFFAVQRPTGMGLRYPLPDVL